MIRLLRSSRARLLGLIGLALATLPVAPARASTPAAPRPDYSAYQRLLNDYIRVVSGRGQPYDARFYYGQLFVDENIWRKKRSARLEAIHEQMLAERSRAVSPHDRIAWALNTYNFLVLEHATMNLLVPGRQFQRVLSVNDMCGNDGGFFDNDVATIDGRVYSLRQFEREFVFGDTSFVGMGRAAPPRRAGPDPRLGFAIVRGATGSPPLMLRAYQGDSLDRQLDQAVRTALALPRFARLEDRAFIVSSVVAESWVDLGGAPGAFAFVAAHVPKPLQKELRRRNVTTITSYGEFDWSLNLWEAPRGLAPAQPAPDSTARKS